MSASVKHYANSNKNNPEILELVIKVAHKESRQKMPEQDPQARVQNFNEVPLGYTDEMALLEASRCLQCAEPQCITGCPVNIDIPGFIRLIKESQFGRAIEHIKEFNILPAVCGRVCPQEVQCEKECVLSKKWDPIAIGALERFLADWEREHGIKSCPDCKPANNIKVAIIGSGPAGLTCAADLARLGYDITIFEAFHELGGVLLYGIPEFRLPKEIVKDEVETLEMLGVKFERNKVIGKILMIEDLRDVGYKAFFIGVGAGLPIIHNMPGLNLNGVLTANEFLTRVNLMKAYKFPDYDTPINIGRIISVIGGGNVAIDSARVALRLGAEKVMLIYRRSEVEMPARREEYHHGLDEGIEFQFLTNPVAIIGDQFGNVDKLKCIRMKLGEPDHTGRRSPIPILESEVLINTDTVILALGTKANPVLTESIPSLKLTKFGYIEADQDGCTNIEDIFAGGDIVTGSATVISAMGAGRKSAVAIDSYLKKKFVIKE
jgi:glutamate synthase (NADPH/NADH) small chain